MPAYNACVLETMTQGYTNAGAVLMGTGGDETCVPFYNWAESLDDSSNPGGGFSVATEATVLDFMLGQVPYFSHYDIMEADSNYTQAVAQSTATTFTHYSKLWNRIPVGGWYGFDNNQTNVLVIDHYFSNLQTWSALGLVCHAWGTDSQLPLTGWNLSAFNVILGYPHQAADQAALLAAVQGGATLIVYTNSGAPASLTGIGTTAVPIPFSHPIYAPYLQPDLVAGGHNGNDFINQVGSGKVVTLHAAHYGDGFSVGDGSNSAGGSDSLASGLAYLTLNAILWAAGKPWAIALPQYVQRTPWAVPLNSNGQGDWSGVGIHAIGYPLQCVLLSSNKTSPTPVNFVLNPLFYSLSGSPSWNDLNTGLAVNGSTFSVTIPTQDWMVFLPTGSTMKSTTLTLTATLD